MREITVTGHVAADPETKTTKNGTEYVTFRIGNHEYNDEEGTTYWFSVTVWERGLQNWCKSLKKGSAVNVTGRLTDRAYISNKTNQPEVGRDIRATYVEYALTARRDDDSQTAQSAPAPAAAPAEAPAAPKAAKTTKKATTAPAAEAQPDDDLPF